MSSNKPESMGSKITFPNTCPSDNGQWNSSAVGREGSNPHEKVHLGAR